MERFIEEGELLLTNFEWAGGHSVKPNIVRERRKLVNFGKAEIVKGEDYFTGPTRTIKRKGRI